jgi:hypothetical protein
MRVLLAATLLLLPSCVHLFTTRVDYTATATAPTVGDSAFRAEFIPKGAESGLALSAGVIGGATVSEIGPYQVRLHAFGCSGDQRSFRVTSFTLTSPGNFIAPMEPRGFEGRAEFKPTNTTGRSRASLLLGPWFRLDEHRDRELVIEAGIEVTRRSGVTRGSIRIPLKQTNTSRRDSHFLLEELWQDIRGGEDPVIEAMPSAPESAE